MKSGMYITDKCSNPEVAVALYNYLLDFDVMLDGYIGPKGGAWDDPDEGAASLQGTPAAYQRQTLVEFITGVRDVETGWDTYLAELDSIGSAELAGILQKAYDAG